jgi:hypothetical protein
MLTETVFQLIDDGFKFYDVSEVFYGNNNLFNFDVPQWYFSIG